MFDMVVLFKFPLLPVSIDSTEQVSETKKGLASMFVRRIKMYAP